MKTHIRKHSLPIIFFAYFFSASLLDATGLVGTSSFQVSGGNSTNPSYYIASAPISADSVFTGTVASTDDANAYLLFDTETNASGDVFYPFGGNSVFLPGMQIPELNASISNGQVTAVNSNYYTETFNSNKDKFTDPPEVVLYDADFNETALVSISPAQISSGKITGFTIDSPGSDYQSAPKIKVIAGPHFVKVADDNNPYNGRFFLITDNNKSRLNLDLSRLAHGESTALSTYFPAGTRIEIIPATTLGSLFGKLLHELPTNWSSGLPSSADLIYIWDVLYGGYHPYFFLGTTFQHISGYGQGWYSRDSTAAGILNNTIIYPDEAFIIAKKTSGDVTFQFEGQVETTEKKLLLPESGNQILAKNPYGADLMIAELVPSTAITEHNGSASLFRAMDTSNEEGDIITILDGENWKLYYYDESHGNTSISKAHILGTRRPLDGTDSNLSGTTPADFPMDINDFLIDDGSLNTIASVESCDVNGSSDQNVTTHSKIFINDASTSYMKGFKITLEDIQGYLLADDGLNEINASTNDQVTAVSNFSQLSALSVRGSIVDSNLNGTFEVIKSGDGPGSTKYVVIEKQRDINFKSDEGSPKWRIGSLGIGYSTTAKFYCIGGNGTSDSNASGTISTSGSITVSTGGAGYQHNGPQAIVSGGGWRTQNDSSSKDSVILKASTGLLLQRNSLSGTKAFIDGLNPFE